MTTLANIIVHLDGTDYIITGADSLMEAALWFFVPLIVTLAIVSFIIAKLFKP